MIKNAKIVTRPYKVSLATLPSTQFMTAIISVRIVAATMMLVVMPVMMLAMSIRSDDIDGGSDDTSDGMPALEPRPLLSDDEGDGDENNNNNDNNNNNRRRAPQVRDPNRLSVPEKLCLGRCHLGFKVGPDTVILTCGGGRPSTNAILGFNLSTNTFFRPNLGGGGMLPPPRFTAAGAVFGDFQSYLFVHGGYNSQEGAAIGNMSVLDLAPALKRELHCLPGNPDFESYPPVTQNDVNRHSAFGHNFGHVGIGGMEDLLQNLFVEFAAGRGRPAPGGRNPREGVLRMMAQLGARHGPGDDDEEGEDDDDNDDDDEVMGPGGLGGAAMMFNMLANGGIRMVRVVHDLMCVCVILFAWLTFCCLRGEGYCRGRRNGNGNARGVR